MKTDTRLRTTLLVIASISGVLLALGTSVDLDVGAKPDTVTVNGQAIEAQEFERALAAIAKDKRNPVTDNDAARIMSRLIEEELLIQRGVEIGLVDRDRAVRSALVAAVIDHALVSVRSDPIDETQLRQWYTENTELFVQQPHFYVQRVQGKAGPPLPNGFVPASTLREYIGPAALNELETMTIGATMRVGSGDIIKLIGSETSQTPSFDEHRDTIEAAYRRARSDRVFREYLDWLHARADIQGID